jgi:hypothetical protein
MSDDPVARKVSALVRSIVDLGGTDEGIEENLKKALFALDTVVGDLYPAPPPQPEPVKKKTTSRRSKK